MTIQFGFYNFSYIFLQNTGYLLIYLLTEISVYLTSNSQEDIDWFCFIFAVSVFTFQDSGANPEFFNLRGILNGKTFQDLAFLPFSPVMSIAILQVPK